MTSRTCSSNFGLFEGGGAPTISTIEFPIVKARGTIAIGVDAKMASISR
jgi:hypothetical protein